MTLRALGGIALLVLSGCKETPEGAWKELQGAACRADTASFFARFDRAQIAKNGKAHIELWNPRARSHGPFAKLLEEERRANADAELKFWYDATLKSYEQDVKRGNAGAWCTAQLGVQEPDTTVVRWSAHGNETVSARFEQRGERWVVVELFDFSVFTPEAILSLDRKPH